MGVTSNKKRVSHEATPVLRHAGRDYGGWKVTKVHIKENLLFLVFFVASCGNCFSWVANLVVQI